MTPAVASRTTALRSFHFSTLEASCEASTGNPVRPFAQGALDEAFGLAVIRHDHPVSADSCRFQKDRRHGVTIRALGHWEHALEWADRATDLAESPCLYVVAPLLARML